MITARRRAIVGFLKAGQGSVYALERAARFETDEARRAELLAARDALQEDVGRLIEALGA